jgi:glycosyltransferase involved in cell wall biosynthesis
VGPSRLSARATKVLGEALEIIGPVPRAEIRKQYDWADVFLLPTLSEGSANVVYEAMAHGLPVITTPNAGSIVRDGKEGLIVPIRDPAAMVGAILELAGDPELRLRMGATARQTASNSSLETYAERLGGCLVALGSDPGPGSKGQIIRSGVTMDFFEDRKRG